MLKRLVFALLAVGLLLGGAIPAYAAQTGSIRVVPETKPPADSAVTLYHAGVEADGGYWLDEVYGGGLVRWGDLPSLTLASWLAEHEAAEGTTVPFDAEGSATFSNLSPGLYLIKQTGISAGNDAIPPFVIELPYEDIWEITVRPQSMTGAQEPPPHGTGADANHCRAGAGGFRNGPAGSGCPHEAEARCGLTSASTLSQLRIFWEFFSCMEGTNVVHLCHPIERWNACEKGFSWPHGGHDFVRHLQRHY